MLSIVPSVEPEIIVWEEGEESPLTEEELLQATYYWSLLGAPGSKKRCRCGWRKPRLELLCDDPTESEKLAQSHLEAGIASKCPVCSTKHLLISEVHAHHGDFLHCRLIRNTSGAIAAARRRCEMARGL
jgi:hypothetical protein